MDMSSSLNAVAQLDEVERKCLIALQAAPRASWRELGLATGIAERTVARRIGKLIEGKLVRVLAELDPVGIGQATVMHAWVRCRTGTLSSVATQLANLPQTQVVMSLAGSTDVMAEIHLRDARELTRTVSELLPAIEGVERVDSRLVLRSFRRAGEWRIQAPLDNPLATAASEASASGCVSLGESERFLVAKLSEDGRASLGTLARECGVSEPTAHRLLQSLIERRILSFRVEVEPSLLGYDVEAIVSVQARPNSVDALAALLAKDPHTRCLFGTSGASQLFWHVLCTDSRDLWDVVTRRLGALDGVTQADVSVVVQAYKRCGILRAGVRLS